MRETFFWLVSILLLIMSGCTPDPVYRMRADLTDDAQQNWFQGRQYVARGNADAEVTLAYERTVEDRHVFQIEVVNRSDTTVTVDPAHFRILPGTALLDPDVAAFTEVPASDTLPAVNPEEELLDIDLERERKEARAQTAAAFSLIEVTADAAGDLAAAANGGRTSEEQAADDLEDVERQVRFQSRREGHERDMRGLSDRRTYWAETVLRRTTLPPGGEARGRVFFPLSEKARYVTIETIVGHTLVRFFYWQYRIET